LEDYSVGGDYGVIEEMEDYSLWRITQLRGRNIRKRLVSWLSYLIVLRGRELPLSQGEKMSPFSYRVTHAESQMEDYFEGEFIFSLRGNSSFQGES
jgi:hypothetical protein